VDVGQLNRAKHHTLVVQKSGGNQGQFPFNQKFQYFRNGDGQNEHYISWGKVSENPETVEFP